MIIILVVVLSLLPFLGVFLTSSVPHTHDGVVHFARMGAYYKALMDGQLPVRWAGDLNYGYGLPLFNFIYQLPYLLSSLFIYIGFGLVSTFKIVLVLSYVLSGIGMFLFGKAFFGDNKRALLMTVFYQYAPFRLVELLVRGSFGEVYAYAFIPFILLGLFLLSKKVDIKYYFLTTIATALLVISHNALSLVFFGVAVGFTIFFIRGRKKILWAVFSLGSGLLLSAFYWLPALSEHKYTYGNLFMKEMYLTHFAPLQNFFIPNITNAVPLQMGGVSVQIGLFHIIGVLLAGVGLYKKKLERKTTVFIIFGLLLFFVAFFFMQPVSIFVWKTVSFLRQFQFPWRFLGVVALATAFLSISYSYLKLFKNTIAYCVFLFLIIVSTIYYWNAPLGFDKVDEAYYWNYPLNTTYFGETDLIWSAGPAKKYPKQRVEPIAGVATITNFSKKSQRHTFTVTSEKGATLVDHLQYFPGWRAYVDEKIAPIEFQDQNWRGEITFKVPKGTHSVRVAFEESKIRLLADILTIGTALFLCILFVMRKKISL